MRRLRTFLFLLPLLISTGFCLGGDTVKLLAIRATGSHEFNESEIASASGLKVNQGIAPAEFKNAADRLAATGAFAQVGYKYGPLGAGMFVEFQVEDAPQFLPVRFENFVWNTDDELITKLAERVPLFHGHLPPGGELVDSTLAALQALLSERGIVAHAGMRMHSPAAGKSIDAISFYVDGLPLIVKDIEIKNAELVPSSEVKTALKSIVGMSFERGVVEESIRYRLETLYQSRGLLHATFDPPMVAMTGDEKNPDIVLKISLHEGLQYKFGHFQWTGNTVVLVSELNKAISKCSTGAVANLPLLVQGAKYANGMYMNKGYLESKVQLMPSYDDQNKTVDYELHVVEGRQFHMGRITVVGLEASQCEKLQNAWKIKPGEPYDASYEPQFIREHMNALRGRPAKTIVTNNPDATVDVRVEF